MIDLSFDEAEEICKAAIPGIIVDENIMIQMVAFALGVFRSAQELGYRIEYPENKFTEQ